MVEEFPKWKTLIDAIHASRTIESGTPAGDYQKIIRRGEIALITQTLHRLIDDGHLQLPIHPDDVVDADVHCECCRDNEFAQEPIHHYFPIDADIDNELVRMRGLFGSASEFLEWLTATRDMLVTGIGIREVKQITSDWKYGPITAEDLRRLADRSLTPTDDWQECEPQDVRLSDHRVRVKTKAGYLVEGKPTQITDNGVCLNDTYTFFWTSADSIFRIPAPIVHPDPAEHPVIFVTTSEFGTYGRPEPHVWDWDKKVYSAIDRALNYFRPTEILDWTPAKIEVDDE